MHSTPLCAISILLLCHENKNHIKTRTEAHMLRTLGFSILHSSTLVQEGFLTSDPSFPRSGFIKRIVQSKGSKTLWAAADSWPECLLSRRRDLPDFRVPNLGLPLFTEPRRGYSIAARLLSILTFSDFSKRLRTARYFLRITPICPCVLLYIVKTRSRKKNAFRSIQVSLHFLK